ncbi:MFS transporter [Nocardioides sp. P5_C9_2]
MTSVAVRRGRVAAMAAFGCQGFVFISTTTRLPLFSDRWDLDELGLSGLLLMVVLLAGVGSVVAERLAARRDSAVLLRTGFAVMALALVLTVVEAWPVFLLGLALYGVALGLVDASTNMQAVAIEHALGRPVLPSMHGAWTFGGILGAGLTLVTPGVPVTALGVIGLVPLLAITLPYLRRVGISTATHDVAVPWRPIVMVGLAMVLFYMVDTAAATWGPTYLDRAFPTPTSLLALATFPYLVASLVARLAGDGLVRRHGAVRLLRAGTLVSSFALLLVVTAPTWQVAVVGFTLLGLGAAVIAPLSFSAAARIAGDGVTDPALRQARVDVVIGRFNQFNYVGGLLGAVLTGVVGADNLRIGFAVPMVLILLVWPLSRHFALPGPAAPAQAGTSAQ